MGDRVAQTIAETTVYYALDVIGLPEVIQTSEGNSYLHLPGVIMAESAEGEVRYLLSDGLGSIRQAVDETGEVVSYDEYDPYGNPLTFHASRFTPYAYTGEWWEQDVGLLHLRARWYWPEDGVFVSRDSVEGELPYLYVRGNPINRIDPSGLYPKETIERSVSPTTLNILKNTRKGLYELLQDAGDGDTADALRIYIDPFEDKGPPYRSLRGGYLVCKDGRIRVYGGEIESLDEYINGIEMEMRSNPHPDEATTNWAKVSDSHYYVRSVYLGGGEFHYYSDFAGQDSPLPDVVAREISGSPVVIPFGFGRTKLIDKFGLGYISWGVSASGGSPLVFKDMDGYVYPPSLGNNSADLQSAILGYGYSFEGDILIAGGGVGYPLPEAGRSINWYTRGIAPLSIGASVGYTTGVYNWGNYGWDHLDEPAPLGTDVAFKPDNGCNCGQ